MRGALVLLVLVLLIVVVFLLFPTNKLAPGIAALHAVAPYVIVALIGAIVGLAEIASTFPNYPREALRRLLHDLREAMLTALEDVRSRGVPERLRSLRASLSLSYQRLSGRFRIVLFYLGVLPGGASEEVVAGLTGKRFEPAARELAAWVIWSRLAIWPSKQHSKRATVLL